MPNSHEDIVREIIEEPNRKPWFARQQNIFTLIGVLLASATLIFNWAPNETVYILIGTGLTLLGNILGEAWRDASKFRSIGEYFWTVDDDDIDE
jgi:hypothetical protein